jgi:hypothetical protein
MTLPINVETVVLCDDIRQEANGKFLLIGVYGGNVVIPSFPANLNLAVWMFGYTEKSGKIELRLRIVGPQEAILQEGMLEVEVKDFAHGTIMAVSGLPIQMQREGKMRVELASRGDQEWTVIKTISLMLAPRPPPS